MKSMIMVPFIKVSKKTYLIIAGLVGLMLGITLFSYHVIENNHALNTQTQRSEVMLRELNSIQRQLDIFSGNTNNPKQQSVLNTIQSQLSTLRESMVEIAKASDIKKVSSQITSVKDDVDIKMSDMMHAVTSFNGGKQYLDSNALPFHVLAVDMIAGLPYVSVDYSNHVSPLTVGDSLAGWQVVAAYNEAGVAEFMNDKNQYVKVVVQG